MTDVTPHAHEPQTSDELDVTFATLDPQPGERFQRLRDDLGISAFGINLLSFEPRARDRIHAHERQEEVYVVLDGELTLRIEDTEYTLGRGRVARVGPRLRRQLINRASLPLQVLAIGGSSEHVGGDGRAWESWDETGPGRRPLDVPMPADLEHERADQP